MSEFIRLVNNALSEAADAQKAAWLENYVKHDIKSLGVGIPEIRDIVKTNVKITGFNNLNSDEQFLALTQLISGKYTEEKLAAVLYIRLFLLKEHETEILRNVSDWFDKEYITDWNVCDWLCVRILTPLIASEENRALSEFRNWNTSANLWKARASLVPFAAVKNPEKHLQLIREFSTVLIKRDERFCKTAVGWVLRVISKEEKKFVSDFLSEHSNFTTPEVVKNATKYF